jgi:tetratricopeptide (TPR) repeat protein
MSTKWKNVSELRFFRWMAIALILLILVPLIWQMVSIRRAEDAAAEEEGVRIVESVTSGRLDAAWRIAETFIGNERASAESLQAAGDAFLAAGRPDEAYLLYFSALRKESSGGTLRRLAESSLLLGRPLDAELFARRAVAEGAGGKSGNLLHARCLVAAGRSAEAVTICSSLLERYPGDPEILFAKAEAFQSIDRFAQSLALWDSYLDMAPEPSTDEEKALLLHAKVQRLRCLEGTGDVDEALAGWSALLAASVASGDIDGRRAALSGRADLRFAAGAYAEAEADLRGLLQVALPEGKTDARLRIALCLHEQGRVADVVAFLAPYAASEPDLLARLFTEERYEPLRGYFQPAA